MKLGTNLQDVRVLATRSTLRRGSLIGIMVLTQRLLAPATAWSLFGGGLGKTFTVGLLLSAVFSVHSLAHRAFSSLAEAELFQRIAGCVLEADVLNPQLLPDEDARSEVAQAIYHTSQVVSHVIPALVADAIASVVLAAVIVSSEPPRVVLLGAAVTLVLAGGLIASHGYVQQAVARAWEAQNRVFESFVDVIDGRLEIVAGGLRQHVLDELKKRTRASGAAGASIAVQSTLSGRLPALLVAAVVALALVVSGSLRQSMSVTLANAALFAGATPAYAGFAQDLYALARASRWMHVVVRVLGAARPSSTGSRPPPSLPARVAFESVSFRYGPEADSALRKAEFAWDGKGALALAGPNGSGKSTCLRLLLSLGAPEEGAIAVGGVPLALVDAEAWRARTAYLPQRPYLPPRSDVARAIRLLAPQSTDRHIADALERVGIAPVLRRHDGNPLAVRIDTLSVGERQRIALARMLCRDARLYLLDEPDANLDRAGVAMVARMIRELAREHMVVFAAHTRELIDAADRVVVLEGGRVVPSRTDAEQTVPANG